jgi:hypothetical protein
VLWKKVKGRVAMKHVKADTLYYIRNVFGVWEFSTRSFKITNKEIFVTKKSIPQIAKLPLSNAQRVKN